MKQIVAIALLGVACGKPIGDPANLPPIAVAGDDRSVPFGEQIVLDGRASQDPDGEIVFSQWTLGEGSVVDGFLAQHLYESPGSYVASLLVTDDDGESTLDEVIVNVVPPGLTARVVVTPDTGARALSPITFDASTSSGPSPLTGATWTFGDGETASGVTVEHAYAGPGTFHVVLTVTDGSGESDTAEIDVTVQLPDVNGIWSIAATPASYSCGAYAATFPDATLDLHIASDSTATAAGDGRAYAGALEDGVLTLHGEHVLATGGGCGDAPVSTTVRATFEDNSRFTATATMEFDLAADCACSAAFTLVGTR